MTHDAEAAEWDRFYAGDGDDAPHWSGDPNPTLVAEVSTLRPGRALDVGCGEGADAVWLADHGWQVIGIDPSAVALGRARTLGHRRGVDVTWICAGLLELSPDAGAFDLVAAHYPVLPRGDDDAAVVALLRAVAPGGTLLVVHHELDAGHAADHGFDPAAHVMPDTLAAHLDGDWVIDVRGARERPFPPGGGHRPRDVVLRARRTSG